MSATKIKALPVTAFDLFAPNGEPLGLFRAVSKWEWLMKLERVSDRAVVIGRNNGCHIEGIFGDIFGDIFGNHRADFDVVSASPDLAVLIHGEGAT